MSVSSELYKVNVVGDGSTPTIAFNRKVFNSTDIKGFKYDTTTNVETALVNGTDFTVAGAGDTSSSVTITPSAAIPTGTNWVIYSDAGNAQSTTLTTAGEFPAKSLEYTFDKLAIGTQEADGKADRALKLPVSDTSTSEIPNKTDRASKYLGFNASGDPVALEGLSAETTDRTQTISSLKGLEGGLPTSIFVEEEGRSGQFIWKSGNRSANVTDDPGEGVWVPPNSDSSGASGAWKRLYDEGMVSANWFGVTLDGSTDDSTALQNAINYLFNSNERGTVHVGPGTAKLGSTITVGGSNIKIEGSGIGVTTLEATHSSGAVIEIKNQFSGVSSMNIDADATRKAGTKTGNYGILHEPADSSGALAWFGDFHDLLIADQPDHGMVLIAAVQFSTYERIKIQDCLGHGMLIDNGTETSRTNKGGSGFIGISHLGSFDNAGHGLCIGGESESDNRHFRIELNNCEFVANALSAGDRKSEHQVWVFCDDLEICTGAVSGANAARTDAASNGYNIAGRDVFMHQNRHLDLINDAVTISSYAEHSSKNIVIDGMSVSQSLTGATSLDPAIVISDSAENVRIPNQTPSATVSLYGTDRNSIQKPVEIVHKVTDQSKTSDTTFSADDDLKFNVLAKQRIAFRAVLFFDGPTGGDIKIAVSTPSGATAIWGPSCGIAKDVSGSIVAYTPASSGSLAFGTDGVGTKTQLELTGEIRTTGTSGEVAIQWAQSSSNASATTVFGSSYLEVS